MPALLAIAGLLSAACGTWNPNYRLAGKREEVVRESAEKYVQDLRWGRLKEAAAQVAPEQRMEFMELFEDSEHPFHFTSVEIMDVILAEDERSRAKVMVSYDLYRPPSINERRVREVQNWTYDRKTGLWQISPDLDVFREVASGVSSGRR